MQPAWVCKIILPQQLSILRSLAVYGILGRWESRESLWTSAKAARSLGERHLAASLLCASLATIFKSVLFFISRLHTVNNHIKQGIYHL